MPSVFDKYAQRAAPRYTSYPTAPHFTAGFSEAVYRGWLARLDPNEPVSLYLHVPFCRQICWYCGCNMKLTARYAPVSAYVQHLLAEIDLVAGALPAPMPVEHVHFGGGTPTALHPDDLIAIMARLRERFRLRPDAELAIEGDPRALSDDMIGAIGSLGFNRASFGVQEFDPKVQAAINRIQPPEMVARATEGLRAAGVARINFDLIYGLPHQTAAALARTVEQCLAMRPDRVALFGYAHVPWVAKNQRLIAAETLPQSSERFAQAEAAADALVSHGYARIGIDHFALPGDSLAIAAASGKLRRNFQGYTSDGAQTLIGLGATSIGRAPDGYVQNASETGAWSRAVAAGRLPIARGHEMKGEDALRAHVIERLMCEGAVDLLDAGRAFGFDGDWWRGEDEALAELERDGLISRSGARLALASGSFRFARIVAAVFDAYFAAASVRHSIAV